MVRRRRSSGPSVPRAPPTRGCWRWSSSRPRVGSAMPFGRSTRRSLRVASTCSCATSRRLCGDLQDAGRRRPAPGVGGHDHAHRHPRRRGGLRDAGRHGGGHAPGDRRLDVDGSQGRAPSHAARSARYHCRAVERADEARKRETRDARVTMQFSGEISVAAPRDAVYAKVRDARFFASCVEGVQDLKEIDADHYTAVLDTRVAYLKFKFNVAVEVVRADPPREIEAKIEGTPLGIVGRLTARSLTRLAEEGGGTKVSYEIDAALTGKLGSLGQPVLRAKAKEMERMFAERMRAAFAPSKSASETTT